MRFIKLFKNYWHFIILFILFISLAIYFPITGNDWFWANLKTINSLDMFWNLSEGNLIGTSIIILITKYKLLRIITYAVITTCMFVIMKNIVNKKNNTLIYIGIFLFMLINNEFINAGYVWTTGFVKNFIAITFLLLILNFNFKDNLIKTNKLIMLMLGIISSLINPIITMCLLVVTLINLIKNKKNLVAFKQILSLLIGLSIGAITQSIWSINAEIPLLSLNFSNNILHQIIPMLFKTNFIIILIMIAFLLFLSIKIYLKGNIKRKIYTILSIFFITLFAIVYLLSTNDIINYIAYILFTVSAMFILLNANNSFSFKKKIKTYYTFKIVYLVLMAFSVNIGYGSLLFPLIIDIIVILEIVNYIFPNNFLDKVWLIVVSLIIFAEIYVYYNVFNKNIEMNKYIENHLECSIYDFSIPLKYQTDYLYHYIPENNSELINYITYYDINVPDNVSVNFYFNESHKE